jgi:hypothetical protein
MGSKDGLGFSAKNLVLNKRESEKFPGRLTHEKRWGCLTKNQYFDACFLPPQRAVALSVHAVQEKWMRLYQTVTRLAAF